MIEKNAGSPVSIVGDQTQMVGLDGGARDALLLELGGEPLDREAFAKAQQTIAERSILRVLPLYLPNELFQSTDLGPAVPGKIWMLRSNQLQKSIMSFPSARVLEDLDQPIGHLLSGGYDENEWHTLLEHGTDSIEGRVEARERRAPEF
jgi:hypothetical protein